MNTLFLVLFRPVKKFCEMKTAGKFPGISLIIVLFLILLNLILMVPLVEKITSLTFSTMSIPENQKETLIQVAYKMRYLQVIGSLMLYVVTIFLYALLLYVFIYIAKEKIKYKEALLLITYSFFIVVIGDLINTSLLYIRGIDAITNSYENTLIGVNMFTSVEKIGATLYTFLCYITPFQLAFVVLLSIGLRVFTNAKYAKVLTISILFWLITILIPTLSVYFSQLTLVKSGMM